MKRIILLATMAALVAMLALAPMALAQGTTRCKPTATGFADCGCPGQRWPCHPSAGGRAASRVGHSDLRDPEAQVVKPGFCGPARSWAGPFGARGSLHPPGSLFVAAEEPAAFLVPVLWGRRDTAPSEIGDRPV